MVLNVLNEKMKKIMMIIITLNINSTRRSNNDINNYGVCPVLYDFWTFSN